MISSTEARRIEHNSKDLRRFGSEHVQPLCIGRHPTITTAVLDARRSSLVRLARTVMYGHQCPSCGRSPSVCGDGGDEILRIGHHAEVQAEI